MSIRTQSRSSSLPWLVPKNAIIQRLHQLCNFNNFFVCILVIVVKMFFFFFKSKILNSFSRKSFKHDFHLPWCSFLVTIDRFIVFYLCSRQVFEYKDEKKKKSPHVQMARGWWIHYIFHMLYDVCMYMIHKYIWKVKEAEHALRSFGRQVY